jgi:hypothetical protein
MVWHKALIASVSHGSGNEDHRSMINMFYQTVNDFFVTKIQKIRTDLEHLEATISPLLFDLNSQLIPSSIQLDNFAPCSTEEIEIMLAKSNKTTCELDPISSTISCQLPSVVRVLTNLINTALSTGQFYPEQS